MSFIFLDESGDLGFNFNKKRTSQYFIITFLFVPNKKRSIEKVIKKTYKTLPKKVRKKVNLLHATKEKPITRRRLLFSLNKENCIVMSIYLNKKNVYTHLQNEKQVLYNYVTNILLDRIYSKKYIPKNSKIELIASRRETNKFLNENFNNYLELQAKNNYKANLNIQIKTPAQEKCLQAVDFISWAIFRKHEYKDNDYYNIIKSKIIEESPLYP
jgi:hypothetical protein